MLNKELLSDIFLYTSELKGVPPREASMLKTLAAIILDVEIINAKQLENVLLICHYYITTHRFSEGSTFYIEKVSQILEEVYDD